MTKYIKAFSFFSAFTAVAALGADESNNVEIEELLILGTKAEKQKLRVLVLKLMLNLLKSRLIQILIR